MRIKKQVIPAIMVFLALGFCTMLQGELVERIYAVVNGELITYSELKTIELDMSQALAQQYKGEELKQELAKLKKNLLTQIIERKIILSHAREKNYDVEAEVDLVIKDIRKQYNIKSEDELKQALASQGLEYSSWRKRLKEDRIQGKYIYEMIGSKIKIDNSAIMAYYKNNAKDFTLPMKVELNCIFLSKTNYIDPNALKEKKETVSKELETKDFFEVAKKYSELPAGDDGVNYYLGEFKTGELDSVLEESSKKLEPGKFSGWLETETGWYIAQLKKRTEAKLKEYKKVRNEIEYRLRQKEQEKRIGSFVEDLKKDSYIKIYGQPSVKLDLEASKPGKKEEKKK